MLKFEKTSESVSKCESLYPDTTLKFKELLEEMYETFCKKSLDYGMENISMGTTLSKEEDVYLSIMGLWFRKNDKIQRLKQLALLSRLQPGDQSPNFESIDDTYLDLAVYSVISRIVLSGDWGK